MMKKNNNILKLLLLVNCLVQPFTLQAMESEKKRDFVFAVFATHRSRADLLNKVNTEGMGCAYNVNSESTVDAKGEVIRNIWNRQDSKWVRGEEMPLPDVVYDFGTYKGAEGKKARARAVKEQMRKVSIPFINPEDAMVAVNNKILFSKVMHENNIPHPETMQFSKKNLKYMLDNHPLLFLKPTMGSKGQGIIIVQKIIGTNPERFTITYKKKHLGLWIKTRLDRSVSKKEVYKYVNQSLASFRKNTSEHRLKRMRAAYLIQSGVDTFRYEGHQTDFRVNTQRGRDGELMTTGIFMRVGGNMSQGGRAAEYQYALEPLAATTHLSVHVMKDRVLKIALDTHRALEDCAGKQIGDLGMDLVIDNNGEPIVIEANHKSGYPHRFIEENPQIEEMFGLPPSLEYVKKMDEEHEAQLIEYARYLAKDQAKAAR